MMAERSPASLQAVRHPEDDAAFLQEQLQALLQVQHLQRDSLVPRKPACGPCAVTCSIGGVAGALHAWVWLLTQAHTQSAACSM